MEYVNCADWEEYTKCAKYTEFLLIVHFVRTVDPLFCCGAIDMQHCGQEIRYSLEMSSFLLIFYK
jgi:hypothetical protein